MTIPNPLTKPELRRGLIYMALSLVFLPTALTLLPLRDGQLNFLYYCVNFAAVVLILRRFLGRNLKVALDRLFPTLYYGALAYLGYETLSRIFAAAVVTLFPDFSNVNDQSVYAMLAEDALLMTIGITILVPVAEECFFRGLIFRGLYDRSPILAYLISMTAFAAIHVVGYIGAIEPVRLLLCFLQYLPAGYCLCFAYRYSGTIFSPILVHSLVNMMGITNAVR